MKEYDVYFSFYSEEYGRFDDQRISVESETPFEAIKKAWGEIADNANFQFASCIRICGVIWKASPLNLQDWLNAEASYHKYELQKIENVKRHNAKIESDEEAFTACELQKAEHYGSLFTINNMASAFGRPHGMLPPSIYAELHYAREFLNLLWDDYDKYSAFQKRIERAEKWESAAMMDFRDSLNYAMYQVERHSLNFSDQLGKDGLCPMKANCDESANGYLRRWTSEPKRKSMAGLPIFAEKDTIANSQTMQFDYQTIVIKMETLPPDKQKPINSLWIANQPDNDGRCDANNDGNITVENAFTGEINQFARTAFWGVLRPEKYAKTDFDAIKAEYASLYTC